MIDLTLNIVLLAFLAITAVAIIRLRNLLAVVMLSGIFSFLSATLFIVMDAPDVAFTEAAVGAGISSVLFLTTLALVKVKEEKPRAKSRNTLLPLLVVTLTGAALVYGTLDLPGFGASKAPAQAHVAPYYIAKAMPETGVPNIVTAVLASYRGFDTLGEVVVIFTAGVAVMLLLGGTKPTTAKPPTARPPTSHKNLPRDIILEITAKTVIPLIMLFALYVQFHGDFGPGGGFQAGVIFAAAFILYALIFGLDTAERVISPSVLRFLTSLGVLLYAGVGVVAMLKGGRFLDYTMLAKDQIAGQHKGILLVEAGVGITVFAVMLTLFFAFAGRGRK